MTKEEQNNIDLEAKKFLRFLEKTENGKTAPLIAAQIIFSYLMKSLFSSDETALKNLCIYCIEKHDQEDNPNFITKAGHC